MNLLEVSDLIEVLRKRLNITAPMGGGYPMGEQLHLPAAPLWIELLALQQLLLAHACSHVLIYKMHMVSLAF